MGLDVSHDCWHGAYSAFMRWRCKLAEVAWGVNLCELEGFYPVMSYAPTADNKRAYLDYRGPVPENGRPWPQVAEGNPLKVLLLHSDCEGILEHAVLAPLADKLEELLPYLPDVEDTGHIGVWRHKTQAFIDGLRLAHEEGDDVEFC